MEISKKSALPSVRAWKGEIICLKKFKVNEAGEKERKQGYVYNFIFEKTYYTRIFNCIYTHSGGRV